MHGCPLVAMPDERCKNCVRRLALLLLTPILEMGLLTKCPGLNLKQWK